MKHFALAGNPNCGKTTLFNGLTGSTAHVGNWPGVTVDKREGTYKKCKEPISIVDLPGIYSLSPYTPEEVISRNYILDEKPDCVINIVDATNLERNLYLTTQILEMNVPVVVALNMMDLVEKNKVKIEPEKLEKALGVPVVCISALKGTNLDALMDKAYNESFKQREGRTVLEDGALGHLIKDVKAAFAGLEVDNPLFHAVKLVENDELEVSNHKELVKLIDEFKKNYTSEIFGTDLEAVVADERYKYIAANFSSAVEKSEATETQTKSDKIDKVLTNRWAAIPIFLVILFLVFHLTFSEDLFYLGAIFKLPEAPNDGVALFYDGAVMSPGVILTNLLGWCTDHLTDLIAGWVESAPDWFQGLLIDGVVGGVFAVIGFLPQILLLFLFFSILEDTGYMARVAFILDRIFRRFGVTGRAFMPMIMGFGCALPATINTRTLADDKERTATIRVIPFFSCGAKLPILTAIAGCVAEYFNVGNADVITFSMYLIGMAMAIIALIVMRNTTMRGPVAPFIMELPQYHAPQFKALMIHLWDKAKHFVKKAFTIILASTIIIWLFTHFDWKWHFLEDEEIDKSILASIGSFIAPIFTPMGFGAQLEKNYTWVFALTAVAGLIAKENVIATMATIALCLTAAELDWEDEVQAIEAVKAMAEATGITWQACIAFIVFNMTTIPCFAATATAKAELPNGKFKWTLLFWIVASFIGATVVYLVLSWWWTIFIVAAVAAIAITSIHFVNKYIDNKAIALQ